jgi:transposase
VGDAEGKIGFHLIQHVTEAGDKVRRQEHRALEKADGESPLTGTQRPWLSSEEHLPERYRPEFEQLKALALKVGRAWASQETLRALGDDRSPGRACRFVQRRCWWATHSRLAPMREVAHLLKRHLENILTSAKHQLTNAVAEGPNSKIQGISKTARGFRNLEHFQIAILFHCGGLDLYPH